MKKTMYLIDVKNEEARVVQCDGLDDYYELLDCSCIDIVQRKIGHKYYDIICDDEGLLVSQPKISAIDDWGKVMLVGNLLVAGLADEEGELTDLDEYDIKYIADRVKHMSTRAYPDGYLMLTQCRY